MRLGIDREPVQVTFSLIKGESIGVSWSFLGLERETFREFLLALLVCMGFPNPRTVVLSKTTTEGKTSWNRFAITKEECEYHGVDPRLALGLAHNWLRSSATQERFGRVFQVVVVP